MCSAEDLAAFGIGDVEVMTDDDGQNVRGLGMFSRTTSAAGISMNILDPNTGSQWNLFNTAFDSSDDTKLTTDVTALPDRSWHRRSEQRFSSVCRRGCFGFE